MDKERVFISNQLACMLPPTALKTLFYLISWQSQEQIKYFQKQFAKTMHLDQAEIEQAIQLLIDKELISASRIDNNWVFELEKKKIQSYFNVPMQKVVEHDGFKLPSEITWNKEETTQTDSFSSISDEQLEKMVQELQRRREEKKKGCQVVYADESLNDLFAKKSKKVTVESNDNYCNNLPF